ncbi:UNVERIFIED_CONTAM: hypothetical protein GTU68_010434 [Idotea baltica]|nr:hypothetical protein [Idotea baltica]
MIAASEAGILTLVMTNPIWVVKTRFLLQVMFTNRVCLECPRPEPLQGHDRRLREDVQIRLYKGFVPGLRSLPRGIAVHGLRRAQGGIQPISHLPTDTKLDFSRVLDIRSSIEALRRCDDVPVPSVESEDARPTLSLHQPAPLYQEDRGGKTA